MHIHFLNPSQIISNGLLTVEVIPKPSLDLQTLDAMRREVVDGKSALAEALTTVEQKNVALSEAEKVKNELREFLEAAEMRHLDFIGLRDSALKEVAAALGEPTAR